MDQPSTLLACGKLQEWMYLMQQIEEGWFRPLYQATSNFALIDPAFGQRMNWSPFYRWKLWRRPDPARRLDETPSPALASNSPAPTNVDAFGNRY